MRSQDLVLQGTRSKRHEQFRAQARRPAALDCAANDNAFFEATLKNRTVRPSVSIRMSTVWPPGPELTLYKALSVLAIEIIDEFVTLCVQLRRDRAAASSPTHQLRPAGAPHWLDGSICHGTRRMPGDVDVLVKKDRRIGIDDSGMERESPSAPSRSRFAPSIRVVELPRTTTPSLFAVVRADDVPTKFQFDLPDGFRDRVESGCGFTSHDS